jgi:hypothetical protein
MKGADKKLRQDALQKLKDGFNATADTMNAGGQALAPFAAEYQPAIKGFNQVKDTLNAVVPIARKAIADTDAIVAEDPPAPQPQPDPTPQPNAVQLEGYIDADKTNTHQAGGWARDRANPTARLKVIIKANGVKVGEGVADQERTDVRDAGFGDGFSGFTIPYTLTPGIYRITAYVGDAELPSSSIQIAVNVKDPSQPPPTPATGTMPVTTDSLRDELKLEAAVKAAILAAPNGQYFETTAEDIVRMSGGSRAVEDGGQIEWRGTLPGFGDLKFMRTRSRANNPDGSTFLTMYNLHIPFRMPPDVMEGWLHYDAVMHESCVTETNENGWKFPGFEGASNWVGDPAYKWGGYSTRTHNGGPRLGANPVYYDADSYEYRPDLPGSEVIPWGDAKWIVEQMGSVDLFLRMNTPKNPATIFAEADAIWAQADALWKRKDLTPEQMQAQSDILGAQLVGLWNIDGVREIWKDNKFIRRDENVLWRTNPRHGIHVLDYIWMNGGMQNPKGEMQITMGPVAFHPTRRIGVFPVLTSAVPAPTPQPAPNPVPTPDPAPTPTPTGAPFATHPYGYFDLPTATHVRGWVVDQDHPDISGFEVVLVRNGQVVDRTVANLPSPDVLAAGFGKGNNRFEFNYEALPPGKYEFNVRVNDDDGGYLWPGPAEYATIEILGAPDLPAPAIIHSIVDAPLVVTAGPLLGCPSVPGPHMAKIAALGDREWLNLGHAAPDPVQGESGGRSWNPKMPYVEALGVALASGQGPHGADDDDVFALDLPGLRWICVDPGIDRAAFADDVKAGRIVVDPEFGYLVYMPSRRPVYAIGAHSYAWPHANSKRGLLIIPGWPGGIGGDQFSTGGPWYQPAVPILQSQLNSNSGAYAGSMVYNLLDGSLTRRTDMDGQFYVPSVDKCWEFYRGDIYFGGVLQSSSGRNPGGFGVHDLGTCQDLKRNRIYTSAAVGSAPYSQVFVHDVDSRHWSRPIYDVPKGLMPTCGAGAINFDDAADRIVTFGDKSDGFGPRACAIDPDKWVYDSIEPLPFSQKCMSAFYSRKYNVHIVHNATDGVPGEIWAYRHKRVQA